MKQWIPKFFILFMFLQTMSALAQVESFGFDSLSFRVGVQLPSVPLTINSSSSSGDSTALNYEQNGSPKLGLGFDWGYLGGYLSFLSLEPAEDAREFGKTEYFDLQFHFFVKNWGFDLVWQDFKGYYLANTSDLLPSYYAANGNLIREDISSAFHGINLIYLYHPERLSYSAAMSGTAIQKSDGGSWSLLAGYSDHELSSDAVLAPETLEDDYGEMGNIKHAHFRTASVGGGYGYTWGFFTTWYFHISASIAIGPQYQEYSTQSQGASKHWAWSGKALLRSALGASGKRYFGGISFVADNTGFTVEDKLLDFTSNFSFLYFGARFGI